MPRQDKPIKAICETLKERGVISDFAYDHFRDQAAIPLPYAIYRRVAGENTSADGVVYYHGGGVDFELYAATPDEMGEILDQVEELLDAEEIFYQLTADTVYIESENFYESLYEI